jgi:hypothetical protein
MGLSASIGTFVGGSPEALKRIGTRGCPPDVQQSVWTGSLFDLSLL